MGVYYFGPTIASFGTFVVYWATGESLTLPVVFSTMSLLQQLRVSMGRQWTMAIQTGSEAIASCHRIEKFLALTAHDSGSHEDAISDNGTDTVEMTTLESCVEQEAGDGSEDDDDDDVLVKVTDGHFTYSLGGHIEKEEDIVLKDINFKVKRGEVLVVVGPVGAGKSSLLVSLLGETCAVRRSQGLGNTTQVKIAPRSRLAYCQQKPFIISSSVRGNVMMAGKEDDESSDFRTPRYIDQKLYEKALSICNLLPDLESWPDYDESEIGESGVSLSGGQRARLSLARAVYSDADIYLLDDPLSACDARVGSKIFQSCILNHLRAASTKAVILTTHQLQYLPFADKIIVLDKTGNQSFYGNYEELLKREGEFSYLELQKQGAVENTSSTVEGKEKDRGGACKESTHELQYDRERKIKREANQENVDIILVEDRIEGTISSKVILEYFKNGGTLLGSYVCILALTSQVLVMITDYWVKWWATNTFFGEQSDAKNVWIFAILTTACLIMGVWRAIVFFQFTLKASCTLHLNCLWSVLHLPSAFFTANPTGRILNRFSKDQNLADEALQATLFDFAANCTLFCVASAILACIAIPW